MVPTTSTTDAPAASEPQMPEQEALHAQRRERGSCYELSGDPVPGKRHRPHVIIHHAHRRRH